MKTSKQANKMERSRQALTARVAEKQVCGRSRYVCTCKIQIGRGTSAGRAKGVQFARKIGEMKQKLRNLCLERYFIWAKPRSYCSRVRRHKLYGTAWRGAVRRRTSQLLYTHRRGGHPHTCDLRIRPRVQFLPDYREHGISFDSLCADTNFASLIKMWTNGLVRDAHCASPYSILVSNP